MSAAKLEADLATLSNQGNLSNALKPVAFQCIIAMSLQQHWNNAAGRHRLGRVLRKLLGILCTKYKETANYVSYGRNILCRSLYI